MNGAGREHVALFRDAYWSRQEPTMPARFKKGQRGKQSIRFTSTNEPDASPASLQGLLIQLSQAYRQQVTAILAMNGGGGAPSPVQCMAALVALVETTPGMTLYALLPDRGEPLDGTSSPGPSKLGGPVLLSPLGKMGEQRRLSDGLASHQSESALFLMDPEKQSRPPPPPNVAPMVTLMGRVLAVIVIVCLALIGVVAWAGSVSTSNQNQINTMQSQLNTAQAQIAMLLAAAKGASPASTPAALTPASTASSTPAASTPASTASSTPASTTPSASTPASTPASSTPPGPGTGYSESTVLFDANGQFQNDNYGGGPSVGQDLGRGTAGTYQFRNDDLYVGRGYNEGAQSPGSKGVTRNYYMACQERRWDYGSGVSDYMPAGSHSDVNYGEQIPAPYFPRGKDKLGYAKKVYVGYTDNTYKTEIPLPKYAGLQGPMLRAVVGDTVMIYLFNNCTIDISLHPHGMSYEVDALDTNGVNEGAWYQFNWAAPGTPDDVQPGGSATYRWRAGVKSGPVGAGVDMSSQAWWYHSHIYEGPEVNLGLTGVLIVTAEGWGHADGTGRPKDVDKEFVLWLSIVTEGGGASGKMYAINGKIFGNMWPPEMVLGDRVRWYLMGIGSEQDLHTVHWHLNSVTFKGTRSDIVELLPGSMAVADMHADGAGWWYLHCHVESHLLNGMIGSYYIGPPPGGPANGSQSYGASAAFDPKTNYAALQTYQLPLLTQQAFNLQSLYASKRDI